jgi:hypothetical protein
VGIPGYPGIPERILEGEPLTMDDPSTHMLERRRLNDEIERAFINTSTLSMDIITYTSTERSATVIDLHERFNWYFGYLILLTSIYPQMRQSAEAIEQAWKWVEKKTNTDNDKFLLAHCVTGVVEFKKYGAALADQGVFVPPSKG